MYYQVIRLVTLLLFCFWVNIGFGQPSIEFNSAEPQYVTPCGPTVTFSLLMDNVGDATLNPSTLTLDLPDGINYIPGSVTSAIQSNISNLNMPQFSIAAIPASGAILLNVQATIDCSLLSNADPLINDWTISGANGNFSYQTSPYNINLPALVVSNLQNFDYQGQVGDMFVRSLTLTNSGFGAVSTIYIEDAFPAPITITNGSPGTFQVLGNVASITLDASDFMSIGDGDGFFEQGESITLSESVTILDCQPGDSQWDIGWGCNNEVCASVFQNADVTVLTELPSLDWNFSNVDYAGFCSPGSVLITVVNNGSGSGNMPNAFNLVLEPGMAAPGQNVLPGHTSCIQLTNFSINGQTISSDTINFDGYGLSLSDLLSDPDGPGGLSDLDNDGQFDDLPFGEAFQLLAEVVVDPDCLGAECIPQIEPLVFKFKHYFENQCGLASAAQIVDDSYLYELPNLQLADNLQTEYGANEIVNSLFVFERELIGYDCPNGTLEMTVELPPVMELPVGAVLTINGSPIAFTQLGNTLNFSTNLLDFTLNIPLVTICDSTFVELANFPCAIVSPTPSVHQIQFTSQYFCDANCTDPVDIFCGSSKSFIVRCENDLVVPPEGISAYEFQTTRRSMGWTDASLSTKVDPLSPGLELSRAMVFDTVRFQVAAQVYGLGNYNNSQYYLFYFNDSDNPYFEYIDGSLTFYDQETNSYTSCTFAPNNVVDQNGAHSMTFDMANLFSPGSCLQGLNITAGDSIFVDFDVVMLDNLPASITPVGGLNSGFLFDYNGEMLSCNEVPAILELIDPGYVFEVSLLTTQSACDTLVFETRLLQGRNSTGLLDPFPFEVRPYARFDSLTFEFPDHIIYVPGSAAVVYETRPDMTAGGPIQQVTTPISDPLITGIPGNQLRLDFLDTPDFPTVDIVKGNTLNNFQFKAFPICMTFGDIDYHVEVHFTNHLYSEANSAPVLRTVDPSELYSLGNRTLNVLDPIFYGETDTATWTIELCNTPFGNDTPLSIPNSFIVLDLPASGVDLVAFTDVSDPNNPVVFPFAPFGSNGDYIVYLGDIAANNCGLYELTTIYTSCDPVEIPILYDFNCAGYPQDSTELMTVCQPSTLTETLQIIPQSAALQINMVTTPPNPVDLCTPLTYELLVINTQAGRAFDINVLLELPAIGLYIEPGSCEWQYGNAGFQVIPDPVQIPGTDQYVWEMDLISNALANLGLAGVGQSLPTEFRIRFQVQTDCSFENLSLLSYLASWENACTSTGETPAFFTPLIQVAGVPLSFNTYTLGFNGPPIQNCAPGVPYTVEIINEGIDTTTSSEIIRIEVDPALDYVPGSFQNVFNIPGGGEPVNYIFNGLRYLEWFLPDGVNPGEIISFNIELFTLVPEDFSCDQTDVGLKLLDSANIPCQSEPGGTCELEFAQADASFEINVEAASYFITFDDAVSEPFDFNSELYTMTYTLINSGSLSGAGLLNVEFYFDVNFSGQFELGTDVFAGQNGFDGSLLGPGMDTTLVYSNTVDVANTCFDIIAVLSGDGNPCICASAEAIYKILPLENSGSSDTLCFGQTVQVGGLTQLGYTYEWIPDTYVSDPSISNPDYSYTGPFPSGNVYTDTLIIHTTRLGGCEAFDTLFMSSTLLEATIDLTSDFNGFGVSCPGASDGSVEAALLGGIAPYDWVWNPGLSNDSLQSGLAAALYELTVTDGLGCEALASIQLIEPPVLNNAFVVQDYNGFSVSCFGAADGLVESIPAGGVGGYSWQWNPGLDENPLDNLSAGDYYLTITDDNGCEFLDTIALNEPPLLDLQAVTSPILCADGSNGTIDLMATGGVGPYSYLSNGFDPDYTINGLNMPGSYDILISDANGCEDSTEVVVGQLISTFELSAEPVLCPSGNEGSICAVAVDAFSPYSYSWQGGGIDSCLTSLTAGNYQVTITDGNGCTYTLAEILDQPDPFQVTFDAADVSCFGGADGSLSVLTTGGTGPYLYEWPGGLTGSVASGLPAGNYSMTLSDSQGCTFEETGTVGTPPEITISLSAEDITCHEGGDGSVSANVNGGSAPYTLNWSNGQSGSPIIELEAGLYLLTVTDQNGCLQYAETELMQPVYPDAFFQQFDITCFGFGDGQIEVDSPLGADYSYSLDGNTFQSGTSFGALEPGTYTLYIQNPEGCIYTYPAFLTEPAEELIFVSPDTSIYLGESANITAYSLIDSLDFLWTPAFSLECPDCASTDATPYVTTEYLVTAISAKGCIDEKVVTIRVLLEEDVFIPNIFTPDLDGINDEFLIFAGPSVSSVSYLKIFDRWGGQVFEGTNLAPNDPQQGWDGTTRGQSANQGVYVYLAEVEYLDGRKAFFKGDVTLIR
ncbi:MAG: gliding motility-associated C-terminal domain-containing protein [Saprospiraceae bacterium]|nr:gliding motility-associated C-terminal domain-containing protein [Saprospiraceae bacterium]